jgi:RNA polymerase sigma-70 factor (ECF subfamily)
MRPDRDMPLDLARLYEDHAPALFAFLLNVTRSETETRDVMQEVFARLAARPERFNGVRDERAFLLRLSHNVAIDQTRRRMAHTNAIERAALEPVDLFANVPDHDAKAFQQAVASAMAELPEDQRAVVHLKIWEELTFAEIAEMLGVPANTAASRYRYALDKLEGLLRPLCEP